MYVERNTVRFKFGKHRELVELVTEWRKKHPFPNAKSSRFYMGYLGTPPLTFVWEWEFESLAALEEGNKQWEAMVEEMAPFFERWLALVEEPLKNELWEIQ